MATPDTVSTPTQETELQKQFRADLLWAITKNIDPTVFETITVSELFALEERLHVAQAGDGNQLSPEDIIKQSVDIQPVLRSVLDHTVSGLEMNVESLIMSIARGDTNVVDRLRSSDRPIPPSEIISTN